MNYDLEMKKIIEKLDYKPSLLLHSCCAPCSTTVIERLKDYFEITIIYYNPNIDNKEELLKRGYIRDEAGDYDNVAKPLETNYEISLPQGFKQVYGYDYPDIVKMRTCHYGFEPEEDDGDLYREYENAIKNFIN